ncbi:MAG: pantoate--beta-alanine ligase [Pseudomonadales bacterium]
MSAVIRQGPRGVSSREQLAGSAAGAPRVFRNLDEWRTFRRSLQGTVGFVPTMGALHAGHGSLLERSIAENDHTVLSIYLNPTQFNNPRDLDVYPRTLERDLALAAGLGVDFVVTPDYEQMYPDGFRYRVEENALSGELCGEHRPGHFTGVLTVVMKLLNLVQPDRAYFGEKDYQQYLLIRDMCDAFFLDVTIVPCATVRESDGLAMSSRNENLDAAGRVKAALLNRLIRSEADDDAVIRALTEAGFTVDYVLSRHGRRFVAASLTCGERTVRLIDNVAV